MSSPRPTRHRTFVNPGYFEGYLEKLESKNKKYKKYWAVLRGNYLYFQVTCRDPMYIDRICLDDFVAVVNEDSHDDMDLQAANLILKLKQGDIKLKADSLESREQWKGFIHTVAKLEIPSLDLLPGQFHRLKEVLEEEIKQRRKSTPPPLPARPATPDPGDSYDDVESQPRCYYKISRVEAEIMLERNMENGNFLMRPGSDNKSIAITTRQMLKNKALIKHYRIHCAENGYIIEVEGGILCSSKQEVINYFVQQTNGVLKPLERSMDYEVNMSFVQEDVESGEVIHRKPLKKPTKTPLAAGFVQEDVESGEVIHQKLLKKPTKTPFAAGKEEKPGPGLLEIMEPEAEYLNDHEIDKLNQVKEQKLPKEALMPPHRKPQTQPDPCRFSTHLGLTSETEKQNHVKVQTLCKDARNPPCSKSETQTEPSGWSTLPRLTPSVNSELQLKLQQRRAVMNDILPSPPLGDREKQ
ncbi:signal-transducing adaptor protein 1-like isoform X2 [Stegostoma tigrinum]|uniref:signal-transducing adaptor protein 1-like isoform X2 n=1 Tax=Stegostoma tigrinum TaxID=3053191 RepID=UPI0028707CC0|nr:signal-transducing adaptor protein 1-like isoform X2 [Stegostoma tigrinum]